jgi:hypothetical protein
MGKVSTGLVKSGYYDWVTVAKAQAAGGHPGGIVLVGLNDQVSFDTDAGWVPFGTVRWDDLYRARATSIAAAFREASVPLVWVGLPNVRSESVARGIRHINAIIGKVAETTSEPDGSFTPYLSPDGRSPRELRAPDGMHFTGEGYRFLADHVLTAMRADPRTKGIVG